MIKKYNEYVNEKLTDNLKGFNEEELRIQFINGKIDIEKYLYNCDKYNFKIDTELFKKLLFDEKINFYNYFKLSKQYKFNILNSGDAKQLFLNGLIDIIIYINFCKENNFELPTKDEMHTALSKETNMNNLLFDACRFDFEDLIKYAIDNGADVHRIDKYLLLYTIDNKNIDALKILLENCIIIIPDDIIQYAKKLGNIEIINLLKKHDKQHDK